MPNPDATQPSPQPAEDLEPTSPQSVTNLESSYVFEELAARRKRITALERERDAALARERELREALEELVNDPSSLTIAHGDITGPTEPPHAYVIPAAVIDKIKALLVQPAAGEETK